MVRKLTIVIILLLIIIFSFSFVYLKSQALGPATNYFNQHWRASFAAIPWLRHALALHNDGDAKADYLGKRYQQILIEVDVMNSLMAHLASLDLFAKRIQEATGKSTSYLISDRGVFYQRSMTADDLKKLVAKYRTYKNPSETAVVYLLYASQMANEQDLLGKTYQEDGIVMFVEALEKFTKDSPETLENYEASTALHEFGHQIGLNHNEEDDCLMNEHAEESDVALEHPEDVITDFCEFEKKAIPIY